MIVERLIRHFRAKEYSDSWKKKKKKTIGLVSLNIHHDCILIQRQAVKISQQHITMFFNDYETLYTYVSAWIKLHLPESGTTT